MVQAYADRMAAMKNRLDLDPEALRWSPLVGTNITVSDEDHSMLSDAGPGAADTSLPSKAEDDKMVVEENADEEEEPELSRAMAKKRGRKPLKKNVNNRRKTVVERKVARVEPRLRGRSLPEATGLVTPTAAVAEKRPAGGSQRRKAPPLPEESEDEEDENELNRSNEWLRPRKRRNIETSAEPPSSINKTESSSLRSCRSAREERSCVAAKEPATTPKAARAPLPRSRPTPKESVKLNDSNADAEVDIKPKRGRPRKRARPNFRPVPETIRAKDEDEEDDGEELLPPSIGAPEQPVSSSPERKSPTEMEEPPIIVPPASQSSSSSNENEEEAKSMEEDSKTADSSPVPPTAPVEDDEKSSSSSSSSESPTPAVEEEPNKTEAKDKSSRSAETSSAADEHSSVQSQESKTVVENDGQPLDEKREEESGSPKEEEEAQKAARKDEAIPTPPQPIQAVQETREESPVEQRSPNVDYAGSGAAQVPPAPFAVKSAPPACQQSSATTGMSSMSGRNNGSCALMGSPNGLGVYTPESSTGSVHSVHGMTNGEETSGVPSVSCVESPRSLPSNEPPATPTPAQQQHSYGADCQQQQDSRMQQQQQHFQQFQQQFQQHNPYQAIHQHQQQLQQQQQHQHQQQQQQQQRSHHRVDRNRSQERHRYKNNLGLLFGSIFNQFFVVSQPQEFPLSAVTPAIVLCRSSGPAAAADADASLSIASAPAAANAAATTIAKSTAAPAAAATTPPSATAAANVRQLSGRLRSTSDGAVRFPWTLHSGDARPSSHASSADDDGLRRPGEQHACSHSVAVRHCSGLLHADPTGSGPADCAVFILIDIVVVFVE